MPHQKWVDLSRRSFTGMLGLASLSGSGVAGGACKTRATASSAHSVRGSVEAFARILGGTGTFANLGEFDGRVMLVTNGGRAETLCRYAGLTSTRTHIGEGEQWRCEHTELAFYYAGELSDPSMAVLNPYSGRHVQLDPEFVGARKWAYALTASDEQQWFTSAGRLFVEDELRALTFSYPPSDHRPSGPFREQASYEVPINALNESWRDLIPSQGGWTRFAPLPAWLDADDADAYCIYQCRHQAGSRTPQELSDPLVRVFRNQISATFWA